MIGVKSPDSLAEGVTYHDQNGTPYTLTKCVVCGTPKISLLHRGEIAYPRCAYCANHTVEKREMMRQLFKGRPKTQEQIEKLRQASTGNTNWLGKHRGDVTKAKLSVIFKGRKLSPETRLKMSIAVKARPPRSLQHRQRLSVALKGRRPDDKVLQASIIANTTRKRSDEEIELRRKSTAKSWCDPVIRNTRLVALRIAANTPEHKMKAKENSLRMWAHRSIEEKNALIQTMVLHANRKPNKQERLLMELIDIACPNEYRYTGDGTFAIAGKIPDFTNVNGHKKVIELFGDYFHSNRAFNQQIKWHRTEQGCKATYRNYGFDCLVIWEKELKTTSPEELISRIRQFTARRIIRSE